MKNLLAFEIINNVITYKVFEKHLAYSLNDQDSCVYINNTPISNNSQGFFFFNGNIAIFESKKTVFYNLNGDVVFEIPEILIESLHYDNNFIVSKNIKKEGIGKFSSDLFIYRLIPFDEIKKLTGRHFGSGLRFENNFLQINYEENYVTLISLELDILKWKRYFPTQDYHDLSDSPKTDSIRKVVGVQENKLIITMASTTIIALDMHSGEILWELRDWEKKYIFFNEQHKWYNVINHMFIEDGKLFNMSGALYYSIDLETQKVEILWYDERPDGYYFAKYFTHDRDFIYFAGGINISLQADKIGIFNRKSLQVEWISEEPLGIDPLHGFSASYNQPPQFGGNKLYGLDTAGNLRIYEFS